MLAINSMINFFGYVDSRINVPARAAQIIKWGEPFESEVYMGTFV